MNVKREIDVKRILFVIILVLSSFLFGCNENLDIPLNNNEADIYYNNDSDLSEYRKDIEELYVELKFNYENVKESKDLAEWNKFKNLFDNKIKSIKEEVSNTRLEFLVKNLQSLYKKYDEELRGI